MSRSIDIETVTEVVDNLNSTDPKLVVKGLNILSKKTFELADSNAFLIDNFPSLHLAIGSLLDVIDPAGLVAFEKDDNVNKTWNSPLPTDYNMEFKSLSCSVDDNKVLMTMLSILRNFSFDVANEQAIAYSLPIIRHLIAVVLASLENYTVYEATHLAFDTLINIGNKVDLTGKRRLHHYHLLDDVTSLDNKSREFLKLRLSNHFAPATSTEYKRIVRSILPIITKSLQSRQRALVIRGLELLTKISQCPENLQVLSIDIRPTLELLVELLCVSTSSAETIVADAIVIGGDTLGRYRQPMSQGLPGMGYSPFFCELSDQEIRDTALDTIYALCVMSNQIQIQFAQVPHSLEILFRIARTAVQSYSSWLDPRALYSKGDGYGRCNQIMSMVFSQPDAAPQFKAMRIELYLAAAQDDSIADIVCNKASIIQKEIKASEVADVNSTLDTTSVLDSSFMY